MKRIVLLVLVTSLVATQVFPQAKTFIREYTYNASEVDSKVTARAMALEQVKRLLLEEVGAYVESELITRKEERILRGTSDLTENTNNRVRSIVAGVTETKILRENWTGESYFVQAEIKVDPDHLKQQLLRIGSDESKVKELEDARKVADEALAEARRLQAEISTLRNEVEKMRVTREYASETATLSASDWFNKAYQAGNAKD